MAFCCLYIHFVYLQSAIFLYVPVCCENCPLKWQSLSYCHDVVPRVGTFWPGGFRTGWKKLPQATLWPFFSLNACVFFSRNWNCLDYPIDQSTVKTSSLVLAFIVAIHCQFNELELRVTFLRFPCNRHKTQRGKQSEITLDLFRSDNETSFFGSCFSLICGDSRPNWLLNSLSLSLSLSLLSTTGT